MKPERTNSYKEIQFPPEDLGKQFIDRWFIPEILSTNTLDPDFLKNVGKTLQFLAKSFQKSDPDWDIPRWEDHLSVFKPFDLYYHSEHKKSFARLWHDIHKTLNMAPLYISKDNFVHIKDTDFLVTTPIDKAQEHVQEAVDAINLYKTTGKLDFYYRNCWPYPKNLKVGSKFFYVDNRAIRGFAVVTDIDIVRANANMLVDTWRWIKPIACDYSKIKPPQKYSNAKGHLYLKGVEKIKVIGEWLDPMPK